MVSNEFSIENVTGTLAYARVPARRRGTQSCDRHGRMDRLDVDGFTVEKNGVVWEVDGSAPMEDSDDVEMHYCSECVDDALRTYDRTDASDMELLEEAVADEWTNKFRRGQMDTSLFSVASIEYDAMLQYCPYCADHLDQVDGTTAVCSVHGSLQIDVSTDPEVQTP